jgi:hypothetical protein
METKLKSHLKLRKLPKSSNETTYGDRKWRKRLDLMSGWLSPSGKLYYCNDTGHEDLADLIEEELGGKCDRVSAQSWVIDAGWIKLHYPEGFILREYSHPDPTQKQLDFMFDYIEKHKLEQDIFKCLERRLQNRENVLKFKSDLPF